MRELEGQDDARAAMVAAWPHMTDKGRRATLRAWLPNSGELPSTPAEGRTIDRGPGLDAFIGRRR